MTILKNIGAVVAGVLLGSVVNMGIIIVGMLVIPLPEGTDMADTESMKAFMASAGPLHFLPPFLAHAAGTFVGAATAAYLATTKKMWFALGIAIWFLFGGIVAITMYGGPLWFKLLDLGAAYLPLGFLGGKLFRGNDQKTPASGG